MSLPRSEKVRGRPLHIREKSGQNPVSSDYWTGRLGYLGGGVGQPHFRRFVPPLKKNP